MAKLEFLSFSTPIFLCKTNQNCPTGTAHTWMSNHVQAAVICVMLSTSAEISCKIQRSAPYLSLTCSLNLQNLFARWDDGREQTSNPIILINQRDGTKSVLFSLPFCFVLFAHSCLTFLYNIPVWLTIFFLCLCLQHFSFLFYQFPL